MDRQTKIWSSMLSLSREKVEVLDRSDSRSLRPDHVVVLKRWRLGSMSQMRYVSVTSTQAVNERMMASLESVLLSLSPNYSTLETTKHLDQ